MLIFILYFSMREKSHMTHQKFFKKITILNPRYSFNFIGNKTIFCGWGSSSVAIHMCSMHEALSLISSNSKQQSNKRTIKKKSLHAQSIFISLITIRQCARYIGRANDFQKAREIFLKLLSKRHFSLTQNVVMLQRGKT